MDESGQLLSAFPAWVPLRVLRLEDLPKLGDCAAVYALRDRRNEEILKFGETGHLRRRILVNFIGGFGGSRPEATTQCVHRELFQNGMIDHVDLAWIETCGKGEAKRMEGDFRQRYKRAHGGKRPRWDRQD
jgi:hypothetical protein